MADENNSEAPPLMDQAKQTAQGALQSGKQTAGQLWDLGRTQFRSSLNGQKDRVATSLEDLSHLVRQTGTQLSEQGHAGSSGYAQTAADRLNAMASGLHDKDISEILSDTEDFARRSPGVFLGISVAAGFMLARFLKSTNEGVAAGASGA